MQLGLISFEIFLEEYEALQKSVGERSDSQQKFA
jgi:hypothetical protein